MDKQLVWAAFSQRLRDLTTELDNATKANDRAGQEQALAKLSEFIRLVSEYIGNVPTHIVEKLQ